MIYAGFDVASRTGIAIFDGDKPVHVESWRAHAKRPEHLGQQEADAEYEAEIAEAFRDHVRPLLIAHKVEHVGYEKPRTQDYDRTKTSVEPSAGWAGKSVVKQISRGSSNLAMLRGFGLCVALVGVCGRLNIPTTPITLDQWRKSFLGYSRAPKSEKDGRKFLKAAAIQQCKLLGITVPNDDCGDAVGIAFHLAGHLRIHRGIRPGELFSERIA